MEIQDFLVEEGQTVRLADRPTDYKGELTKKKVTEELMPKVIEEMQGLQERLAADNHYGLLVVMQAMDAAGKDGTIKHVFAQLNPAGVQVRSFKQPSVEEKDHDYMWRINKALPARGEIGIFNRSHYEDVVVSRIHNLIKSDGMPEKLIKKDIWERRYRQICDWERYLTENGFPVVKIFLHVSKDEQRKRLVDRIVTKQKNWKFSMSDIQERQYWDRYQKVYGEVLSATSTKYAPWYVVPADSKWFLRYSVAQIVRDELKKINPQFPKLSPEVEEQLERFRKILQEVDIDELAAIKQTIK